MSTHASRTAPRSLGPVLALLLPLLTVAAGFLGYARWSERPRGERARPPEAPGDEVDGWVGTARLAGGVLWARLAPLQADAERQRFEARALRARFALGEGAPWRLDLYHDADGGDAAGPAAAWAERLEVLDEQGVALRALALAELAESGSRPADPLAVLLSPPGRALLPREEISVVLWGRAPEARPRVRGLLRDGDGTAAAELALQPTSVSGASLARSLARLEPQESELDTDDQEESR